MRSTWIEHKGRKILYQDFSQNFYNSAAVQAELEEVKKLVLAAEPGSLLVLSDFRDTAIAGELLRTLNAASKETKDHIRKTAVLGVTGVKRQLADMLTKITGQPLRYFDELELAKEWLIMD